MLIRGFVLKAFTSIEVGCFVIHGADSVWLTLPSKRRARALEALRTSFALRHVRLPTPSMLRRVNRGIPPQPDSYSSVKEPAPYNFRPKRRATLVSVFRPVKRLFRTACFFLDRRRSPATDFSVTGRRSIQALPGPSRQIAENFTLTGIPHHLRGSSRSAPACRAKKDSRVEP